jgi:hypothetical protein
LTEPTSVTEPLVSTSARLTCSAAASASHVKLDGHSKSQLIKNFKVGQEHPGLEELFIIQLETHCSKVHGLALLAFWSGHVVLSALSVLVPSGELVLKGF